MICNTDVALAAAAWCQDNITTGWRLKPLAHRWGEYSLEVDDPQMLEFLLLKFTNGTT